MEIIEDKLNRDSEFKKLKKLIDNINIDGHVIALDAPWGTGKSWFIDNFIKDYIEEKDKYRYINYNAWENDYTDEAFLSFFSEAVKQIGKEIDIPEINSLKKLAVSTVKFVGKAGVNFVSNYIGREAIEEYGESFKGVINGVSKDIGESTSLKLLDSLDKSKQSRENFHNEFKKLIEKSLKECNNGKFICFIDELDRCRPLFAIELLESIKHLFNIPNLTFVIAVDREQLSESIKAVYGNNFDANRYLNRFFDYNFHINNAISSKFINYVINTKREHYTTLNVLQENNFIFPLLNIFNMSCRDFIQIVNQFISLSFSTDINESESKRFFIYCIFSIYHMKFLNRLHAYLKSIPKRPNISSRATFYSEFFENNTHSEINKYFRTQGLMFFDDNSANIDYESEYEILNRFLKHGALK